MNFLGDSNGDKKKSDSFIKKFGIFTSVFSGFGCIVIFIPLFVVLFILGLFEGKDGGDSVSMCHSVPSVDSVCSTVVVNGSAPMEIDDYVAGVVQAEVGGFDNIEIKKALAVAARTYALNTAASSNGTCDMGSAGQGSQAYSDSPNQEAIQAAQDTSGMILVDDSGKAVFSQYDAFAWYEEKGGYFYVSQGGNEEEHQKIPSSWVRSKYNQATLDWYFKYKHGKGLSQVGGYYLASEKGYDFEKILDFYYSDEGYTLASTNGSANQVCSGNMQTLDHYTLYHEGLNKLTKPLTSNEISNLNAYLENEIKKAGHGSGAAVAAVGQGLVYWLEKNKTAYLGYYWGGGHGDTVIGGDPKWGTNVGIRYTFKGNPTGPEYGLDCSGFVSWATRMACNPGFGSDVSGGWINKGKKLNSVRDTEPGDVITNAGHIMLVVKNNGDGTAIIAEETGSKGLIFSVRDDAYASGYYIRSMKDWYAKNCTDIRQGTGSSGGGSVNNRDDLTKQIKEYVNNKASNGKWAVYVRNLKTHKTYQVNSSSEMTSASVIKLFIAGATYEQIDNGTFTEASVSNDLKIMIENSDNDAANRLINKVGMSNINNYISNNSYNSTKLNRLMLAGGKENVVSAKDVGKFLEKVYDKRVVNSNYSDTLLGYLKNQNTKYKIPAGLGCDNCSASKSGELPNKGVANDAAIVYSSGGDYIIVVLSEVGSGNYSSANKDVTEISRIVYNYFN